MAIELSFRETGSGEPLVILHGLFGAKRNWWSIAKSLGLHRRVLAVDLRNHGDSPWDPAHDYPAMADDVGELIRKHAGGTAAVLGHSMGGKVAMTLALTSPERVDRLVVVDIAPSRSERGPMGHLRTMKDVPLAAITRRSQVDEALAETIADPAIRAFLAQNVVSGPEGFSWAINLDAIERHAETILGFPEVPPGRRFEKPTLFIAGGRSDYIQPRHREEIERLFPAAVIEVIDGAGHWVHADAPQAVVDAVERFLAA